MAGRFGWAALLALTACGAPTTEVSLGGDVVPLQTSPIGVRREAITVGDGPLGAHVIFLDFDGGRLTQGFDDATANVTQIIQQASVNYPSFVATPYAPALDRAAAVGKVVSWMQQFYAPFNAQIVSTRPASGRYTMCMIGGTPTTIGVPGQAAGVAPLDCGNQVEENVVYGFSGVLTPDVTFSADESLKAIGVTCAQEVAHAFGLGHTTNQADIMYPALNGAQTSFGGSSTLQNDGSGQCSTGGRQDSHGMLLSVMGAAPTCKVDGDCMSPVRKCASGACIDGTPAGGGGGGGGDGGSGAVGGMCAGPGDCPAGICVVSGSNGYCTTMCDPAVATSCPSGYACRVAPDDPNLDICQPKSRGGCALAGLGDAATPPWGLALLLGAGLAYRLRRRRA